MINSLPILLIETTLLIKSKFCKKISGRGQTSGFIAPLNNIPQRIDYKKLFTEQQKRDLLNSIQKGVDFSIQLTKGQTGAFIGCSTL